MKVATGLSKISGMFRRDRESYYDGGASFRNSLPTMEEVVRAAQNYDPIKARRELMKERKRRYAE